MPFRQPVKAQDRKILIRNAELSSDARFLWCLIETWADADGGNARPSKTTLALAAGHSEKWVKKYLRELKKAGCLKITKWTRKGQFPTNLYTLSPRAQNDPSAQGPIRTLNQVPYTRAEALSVESEAILHLLPPPTKKKSAGG